MCLDSIKSGSDFRNYRRLCGLTQKNIAKTSGIPAWVICSFEKHSRWPKPEQLQAIIAALQQHGGLNTQKLTGLEFKKRRRSVGLKQEDIAVITGIPQASISAFELGERELSSGNNAKLIDSLRYRRVLAIPRIANRCIVELE